jgi:hypothetical protein
VTVVWLGATVVWLGLTAVWLGLTAVWLGVTVFWLPVTVVWLGACAEDLFFGAARRSRRGRVQISRPDATRSGQRTEKRLRTAILTALGGRRPRYAPAARARPFTRSPAPLPVASGRLMRCP